MQYKFAYKYSSSDLKERPRESSLQFPMISYDGARVSKNWIEITYIVWGDDFVDYLCGYLSVFVTSHERLFLRLKIITRWNSRTKKSHQQPQIFSQKDTTFRHYDPPARNNFLNWKRGGTGALKRSLRNLCSTSRPYLMSNFDGSLTLWEKTWNFFVKRWREKYWTWILW